MASDFARSVNEFKAYAKAFVISPRQLQKFATKLILDWKKVKFIPENKDLIPANPGIYAFVVEHNGTMLPPHGYVMYIGMTGDTGKHNLQKRYGNYLHDMTINKRPGIHYMLDNWGSCLFFHYAEVKDKRFSLRKLEKKMNDALVPPYSKNDFSAEVREAKSAF